jgi:hypothetical protein
MGLLDELDGLNRWQHGLVVTRTLNPTDQELQLQMDRQQTNIDIRRAEIEGLMMRIANSN